MISDEFAQQLHDKASRCGTLSPSERAELDAWLSAQDKAESAVLSPRSIEPAVAHLRSQVNSALEQVGAATRSIQQLTAENELLRGEVASLRRRLAARPVSHPA
jgi:hypothetical protein